MNLLILALTGQISSVASVIPTPPTIPVRVFDATTFGAKADSSTDNAAALQKALDSVATAGGGVLTIPASSKPYLSGPIVLKSSTELHLDQGAVLQMLPFGRYPQNTDSSYRPLVLASNATDVAVTGKGTIEGDGSPWWSGFRAGTITKRPAVLVFNAVKRVLLQDFHLTNAPNANTSFHYQVSDVTVRGISITAPGTSPNTDGCDLEGTRFLFDCDSIQVGDDNIAISPNHDATSDIVIQDCFFGTGHGLSVGSWCKMGINGLTAVRDTFMGTTSGIRLKAGRDRGGMIRNLSYSDILMKDVQTPIYIASYYPEHPPADSSLDTIAPVTALTPLWHDITISNLTSTSTLKGYSSVTIYAVPEAPVESLTLSNVHFTAPTAFSIQHSHDMVFRNVTYNGSSTSLFGTARDTTFLEAAKLVARAPSEGRKLSMHGGVATLDWGASGESRFREILPDGTRRDLGHCTGTCRIDWKPPTGVSWIQAQGPEGTWIRAIFSPN